MVEASNKTPFMTVKIYVPARMSDLFHIQLARKCSTLFHRGLNTKVIKEGR